MSTVSSATSGTPASGQSSSAATDPTTLVNTFDQFLTLLTTQLKNQNPLDPLDTNQFTAQIVQFASVGQLIKSNTTLSALLTATKAANAASAANYVGMEITADGATSPLSNGRATWTLNASGPGTAEISILNASKQVVWKEQQTLSGGDQTFTWDGRTTSGPAAPDGDYTISVVDRSGRGMTVSTGIAGTVDAVEMGDSGTVLRIGAISVPLDQVKSVRRSGG